MFPEAIRNALLAGGLLDDGDGLDRGGPADSTKEAVYDYHDETGALLFQVVRYRVPSGEKTFRQRRPDGRGGWAWKLGDVRRVVYRLPELKRTTRVIIVEGEKDADRLWTLGLHATTNAGGAEGWRSHGEEYVGQLVALGIEELVVIPDHDLPGTKRARQIIRDGLAAGLQVKYVELGYEILQKHGRDVSDWLGEGHTGEELTALVEAAPVVTEADLGAAQVTRAGPWGAARPAPEFLDSSDEVQEWLEKPLLSPGSITEVFSPRGIGKTHVAHALGVKLARTGKRVLLLDRDNSRREVRRRLRAWGAAETTTLKVMVRDEVPPLTDAQAWRDFPFREYELVVIDSLDAATEGVGEKDSAKPSKAIAPMLDIARRDEGPAILVLGNTVKTAEHGRGSGVIEDRADVCFEVRDATDLKPTGTKPWWTELPPAGAGAWAERAARRKRRSTYRLAFVPSKFRVGEEPDPFIFEISLASEPWTLRDVTGEVVEAGETARQEAERQRRVKLDAAAEALVSEIGRRAKGGDPMLAEKEAIPFLMDRGLKRAEARQLLADQVGRSWGIEILTDRRGHPRVLRLAGSRDGGQSQNLGGNKPSSETPELKRAGNVTFSADRIDTGRRKTPLSAPALDAGIRDPHLFPPRVSDTGAEPLEEIPL